MGKHIVNGNILIGHGEDAHFATLEEFDTWKDGRRKIYPNEPFQVTVRFGPNVLFKDTSLKSLLKRWDLVRENLTLTITDEIPHSTGPHMLDCAIPPLVGLIGLQLTTPELQNKATAIDRLGGHRPVQRNLLSHLIRRLFPPV